MGNKNNNDPAVQSAQIPEELRPLLKRLREQVETKLPYFKVTVEQHNVPGYPGGRGITSSDTLLGNALSSLLNVWDDDSEICLSLPLVVDNLERCRKVSESIKSFKGKDHYSPLWKAFADAAKAIITQLEKDADEYAWKQINDLADNLQERAAAVDAAQAQGKPCPECGEVHESEEGHDVASPGFVMKPKVGMA